MDAGYILLLRFISFISRPYLVFLLLFYLVIYLFPAQHSTISV